MYDVLVIGGGVIGLRIAIRWKELFPKQKICLIEKESAFGMHASRRNSGVIHAGFYYSPDSLKAKLTREGSRRLRTYCAERNIPLLSCGKLVVAQRATELSALRELFERGQTNGVELYELDEKEVSTLDPNVRTVGKAVYSPTTASVDPSLVVEAYVCEAEERGVILQSSTQYLGKRGSTILTTQGEIKAGYVVNAAGLYADKIARDFGCARELAILPFKGLYLVSKDPNPALRMHVYPVPHANYPFLGVHFTRTVDGKLKIGPTAIPAFWRENYTLRENFKWGEFGEIMANELGLLVHNRFHFAKLAWEEMQKFSKRRLLKRAASLVHVLHPEQYHTWGQPGIRAQLIDKKKRTLVMDFCVERTADSLHILNAVSPAFTCAISFAEYVLQEVRERDS